MSIQLDIQKIAFAVLLSLGSLSPNLLFAQSDGQWSPRPPLNSGRPSGRIRVTRYSSQSRTDNGFYMGFSFMYGQSNFSAQGASMQTSFNYTSSIQQLPIIYRGNSVVSPVIAPSPVIAFGVEFGSRKGSFYGLNMNFANPTLSLHRNSSSSNCVDLKYGYNFVLSNRFTLRPAVLMGFNYLRVPFDEGIDNVNVDLYIFGKTFAYKTLLHSRYGSRYVYNTTTGVNFYQVAFLPKLQLEFAYKFSPHLALTMNAGYCWTLATVNKVEVANQHKSAKVQLGTNGLDFSSTLPPSDIFNYAGPYFNVGLSLRLGRNGVY